MRAETDLEKARVILQQQHNVDASLQPVAAQQVGNPVGTIFKLTVGHCVTACGHDEGRLVGMRLRVD